MRPGKGRRKRGSQTGKQEQSAQDQYRSVFLEEAQEGPEGEQGEYRTDENNNATEADGIQEG
ncbi:MAG TPA: hypothetical protein PLP42_13740 [Acidobacteriota bacterium]|nr:hypothetical protein [Acidobacteriota bacterium]